MHDLANAVFLMAVLPGAVVGLLAGVQQGAAATAVAVVAGAAGGLAGALALSALTTPLNIEQPYISPLIVIGGSLLGGVLTVAILAMIRRAIGR